MVHFSTGTMATESESQTFYAGEFRHTVDEKNRLTIPARWRRAEGEDFIILPDAQQQFLLVMSAGEFGRITAEAATNSAVPPRDRRVFLRQLHAKAQHGASDKQGRLVLPDETCRQLNLRGEVALVGGRGRFEIWNVEKWQRAQEAEAPTYQHVADAIGL
ncbi:division/cell wall cluster transcriptional repressor MraZ [soil metagenome]